LVDRAERIQFVGEQREQVGMRRPGRELRQGRRAEGGRQQAVAALAVTDHGDMYFVGLDRGQTLPDGAQECRRITGRQLEQPGATLR
jgi:hypothetical protein